MTEPVVVPAGPTAARSAVEVRRAGWAHHRRYEEWAVAGVFALLLTVTLVLLGMQWLGTGSSSSAPATPRLQLSGDIT